MAFNMGVQIALPDPNTTVGQFTINVPLGCDYTIGVVNNQVFMFAHIQSLSTIPTTPPTVPLTFTYRALNTSWRDDTATQYNNYVAFVPTTGGTFILTLQTPIS